MVCTEPCSSAPSADSTTSSSEDTAVQTPNKEHCVRWLIVLFNVLCGSTVGYDLSVASVVLNKIVADFALCGGHSIQEAQGASCAAKQAVMSMCTAGNLCGKLFLPWIADRFGRRIALFCADIMIISAVGMQCLTSNPQMFILARFFLGLSLGFATVVESSYVCEVAPPSRRGAFTVLNEIALCAGYLLGLQVTSMVTLHHASWRFAVALSAIPALFQLLLLPTLPESPRWLAVQGYSDRFERSAQILGLTQGEVNSLRNKIQHEAHKRDHGMKQLLDAQRSAWQNHSRAFFIALGFSGFSVGSSIFSMQAYARDILRLCGVDNPTEWQPFVGYVKLGGAIVAMAGVDTPCLGRRRLATAGAIGCCLCQVVIAAHLSMPEVLPVVASVMAFLTFVLLWNVGYGGLGLTIPFEVVPNDVRSVWVGQIFAIAGIIDVFLTQYYLSLLQASGAGTFLFFAVVNLAASMFAAFVLPDVGNQSLEDVSKKSTKPSIHLGMQQSASVLVATSD